MSLNQVVTVTEAMSILGTKNRQVIMNLIGDGTITGEKKGWTWMLNKDSVLKAKKARNKK